MPNLLKIRRWAIFVLGKPLLIYKISTKDVIDYNILEINGYSI